LLAINLQMSFLTPPFGYALFYLSGMNIEGVNLGHIYRGVVPFLILQASGCFSAPSFRTSWSGCPTPCWENNPGSSRVLDTEQGVGIEENPS